MLIAITFTNHQSKLGTEV